MNWKPGYPKTNGPHWLRAVEEDEEIFPPRVMLWDVERVDGKWPYTDRFTEHAVIQAKAKAKPERTAEDEPSREYRSRDPNPRYRRSGLDMD